ncbi:hypothetical protein JTE90_006284 [Oedothorax gibbosus]|uniref:Uncharacterized protein n=1 Tax=Oedothorax gibbosus TaxID=931172 RepID=A0AAV6U3Q0_9ARAC|nr:hypothetical protein JTE90_006284 [Oedothorax gibbosus]
MDSTDSNVYVAELLQQLEELKRKKARRLQKLKKLKKTPSHNESVGKDISRGSTETVSPSGISKQDNSVSKCAKCGLSLISKSSACIQCISTEHKENKPKDSDKYGITLDGESIVPENLTIVDPETAKFVKPGLKHKNLKEISNLNSIDEVQNGDSQSVFESVSNKIDADSKERLSCAKKQRKRLAAAENDPEEGDHKKLKLSKETSKNISDRISMVTYDTFNGNNNFSSFVCENESKKKPQSKGSDDGIDESIFKDMSCFLSSSPLVEDDEKIMSGIDKPNKSFNESPLKPSISSAVFFKDIHNSLVFNNAAEATDSDCCFQNEYVDNCKPEHKVEAVSNDPFLNGKSTLLNTDITKQPEIVSNTVDKNTLEEIPAEILGKNNLMVLEDSTKDHVLEKKLLTESNVSCVFPTQNPFSLSNEVTKDLKYTFSSFSVTDEPTIKSREDTCEDLLTDSQLVKDLKTEDFSSFENSDSPEKVQPLTEMLETPNLFIPNRYTKEPIPEIVQLNGSHNTNQLIPLNAPKVSVDNETPNLLEHCNKKIPDQCNDYAPEEDDLNCIPETSALKCDKVQLNIDVNEAFYDDAMTADIDFESTSLEVADTLEDLLTKSNNGSVSNHSKPSIISNEYTSINVLELNHPETEIFTIPETVLLEPEIFNNNTCHSGVTKDKRPHIQSPVFDKDKKSKTSLWLAGNSKELQSTAAEVTCDYFEETQCDSLDQLQTIQDSVLLYAEDSRALGNCRDFPFMLKKVKKESLLGVEEISVEDQDAVIKFSCSLQGDIDEPVKDIKLVTFNERSYIFIQHLTWIQAWREEESKDWSKIFSHQVDDELQLKEICFTKDSKHLILIMLLHGDQVHCLQFLLFESEARVIKLMEHTHWMNNKCPEETVLLCSLEDLQFATAQGKDHFEVFVHIFSSLDDHPRLAMVSLGSTPGLLHSLCRIEKLPNALMGTSHSTLYVWHLLEARLVTSVSLQLPDQLTIEKCIWATIESGLVFLMMVCKGKDDFQSCQLLATNLATGFCQTAMAYSFMPSKESQYVKNKNLKAIYNEPFLAVSSEDGCFLWSVSEEYCFAALGSKTRVTAVNIGNDREDQLILAVGNVSGCVHCYSLKCH